MCTSGWGYQDKPHSLGWVLEEVWYFDGEKWRFDCDKWMVINGRNSVSKGMEAGKYRVYLGNKT